MKKYHSKPAKKESNQKITPSKTSLLNFFKKAPLPEVKLKIERMRDLLRY